MFTSALNSNAHIKKPFFLSPKIRLNKIKQLSITELKAENGFTLVELIVVVMMIGILSSIAIPQFMSAANKAKQKEASTIVATMVKAATAYNTEYGVLPEADAIIEGLEEYAQFQKCGEATAESRGAAVCKDAIPVKVQAADVNFISTSGHYLLEYTIGASSANEENPIFQVRANPSGGTYARDGSAVTGCYNAVEGVSKVTEFPAQDKGPQTDYPDC